MAATRCETSGSIRFRFYIRIERTNGKRTQTACIDESPHHGALHALLPAATRCEIDHTASAAMIANLIEFTIRKTGADQNRPCIKRRQGEQNCH